MKIKNIRAVKTTLLGFILIGVSLYYLLFMQGENNTIIFGLIVLGIFLVFSPDTIFKNGSKALLRILGITTSSQDNNSLGGYNNHGEDIDNEIPNER